MEVYRKQCNKEYMRLAMLKQEEIFRFQVQELHRVYKIQKSLMREIKDSELKKHSETETCSSKSSESNSYQRNLFSEEQIKKQKFKFENENNEETDLDLSLTIGNNTDRSKKKKKEVSITSESCTSFSSSCNEIDGSRLNFGNERVMFLKSNPNLGFANERNMSFSIDGHVRNENLNQAPWMYQCVNLNFT